MINAIQCLAVSFIFAVVAMLAVQAVEIATEWPKICKAAGVTTAAECSAAVTE